MMPPHNFIFPPPAFLLIFTFCHSVLCFFPPDNKIYHQSAPPCWMMYPSNSDIRPFSIRMKLNFCGRWGRSGRGEERNVHQFGANWSGCDEMVKTNYWNWSAASSARSSEGTSIDTEHSSTSALLHFYCIFNFLRSQNPQLGIKQILCDAIWCFLVCSHDMTLSYCSASPSGQILFSL